MIDGSLPESVSASTSPLSVQNGIVNINITLDPSKFANGSQEFVGAAVYHECFHALIKYLSNGNYSSDDQHVAMFTNYLGLLGDGLNAAFPNMQPGDANGLLLVGLLAKDGGENPTDSDKWSTAFVNKVLSFSEYSRTQVLAINNRYQILKTSGTSCN